MMLIELFMQLLGLKLFQLSILYISQILLKFEFSVESAANFTFQKIDENEIQKMGENKKLNEKINTLEKRLNDLEIRMDKFEKKLLNIKI